MDVLTIHRCISNSGWISNRFVVVIIWHRNSYILKDMNSLSLIYSLINISYQDFVSLLRWGTYHDDWMRWLNMNGRWRQYYSLNAGFNIWIQYSLHNKRKPIKKLIRMKFSIYMFQRSSRDKCHSAKMTHLENDSPTSRVSKAKTGQTRIIGQHLLQESFLHGMNHYKEKI